MATNIELNAGSGGAKLASYKDAAGNAWAPAVLTYVTDTTDNAAVVQPVQVGHGLPVQQDGPWVVTPGDTPNTVPWLASINQGGNTAVVTADGALTVTGDLTVGAIESITDPVTVSQSNPANLKATINIASAQTLATVTTVGSLTSITNPVAVTQSGSWTLAVTQSGTWNVGITGTAAVTQSGAWNVGTVSTVTAVTGITNPVAVTQSGTWAVGLSAAQTLANVTTVGTITNPVTVAQATAGNLNATVSIAAAQTLATVTTVGTVTTVTNPVTVAQSNAANLLATVNIASAQTLATVTTVGTVTNVTTVGTITNPVGIAAGTNLIGKAAASNETSTIYNGSTALTPKFAKFTASSSGNTSVVALVSGKKIRVLRLGMVANGSVNVKFQSSTNDITGLWYLTQYASGGGGFCPVGLFETAAGEALNINLSAAVAVSGILTYCEI